MNFKGLMRKSLSLMLMLVLSAGLIMAAAPETYAASSGKLVKTVKSYSKSGKKWKLNGTTTYKYNKKGDPVSITITSKDGSKTYKTRYTIAYTYVKGKKTEAKEYYQENGGSKGLSTITAYDSKARASKTDFYDTETGELYRTVQYVYGKNGYITKIKGTYGDTVINYKWNGKKPKALRSFIVVDGSKSKLAMTKFNKKGFIEKPEVYTQADPDMTYTYKIKKGLVKTVNLKMQDGYKSYYSKSEITYTKKSISQKRYRSMINAVIGGNYPDTVGVFWY